jgi:hypothetical protein
VIEHQLSNRPVGQQSECSLQRPSHAKWANNSLEWILGRRKAALMLNESIYPAAVVRVVVAHRVHNTVLPVERRKKVGTSVKSLGNYTKLLLLCHALKIIPGISTHQPTCAG